MAKTTQELIEEIRRLARGRIDNARRDEVLDEVRAHLDASIQARLELGLTHDEADKNAVASFGDPRDFVAQLSGAEDSTYDSRFDRGVCLALLIFTLLTAALFDFVTVPIPQEFMYPILLLLAVPLCWRSWKATRPQLLPLVTAFLVSIPIYAADFPINGAKFRFHFEWGMGADGAGTVIGIWAFCSFISWLCGSIWRGNVGRELRVLRTTHEPKSPRFSDALILGGCTVVAIVAVVAESLSWHDTPAELWTGVAVLVPVSIAALQGWRWEKLQVRSLLLGAAISIPLAINLLSKVYVAVPSFGEVIPRSEVASWMKSPDVDWQQGAKAQLDKVIDRAREEIDSHAPPYKVPLTVVADGYFYVPYRTAQSKDQALQMLSHFREKQERWQQKQEALWVTGEKEAAQYRKDEEKSLSAPLALNGLRLSPLALDKGAGLWVIIAAAQGLAAMAKSLLRRRIGSKRGLA